MALAALKQSIRGASDPWGAINTFLSNVKTLVNALSVDVTAMNALLTQMRTQSLYRALGNPGFVISTNFDVKNGNAISYLNGGTLKTLSANTNFDTGTTKTCATTKWVAALLTVDSSGNAVLTYTASTSYNSEALAIAALPAPAAMDTVLGYVTIQAAGSTWTAGTDALQGGTGGTAATTTNYYNSVNPNSLMIGSAVTQTASGTLKTERG